jgi:zinc protease
MTRLRSSIAAVAAALLVATAARALGPTVSRETLPNRATLLVSEQSNLPIVLVGLLLDAGARRDPPGRAGVANLTADLLTEGTATRSAAEISRAIDFVGGSLDSTAAADYADISLRVLKKDLDVGLDLFADILLHPAFAGDELSRRKEAVLASIRAERDDPNEVAQKAFREALFDDEPYGSPVEGTESTVRRITRDDVRSFYESYYRPAGAVVVVVGDITVQEARTRMQRALAGWNGPPPPPFRYPPAAASVARTVRIDEPITQASIILGQRGVARDNPDWEALSVMNYVLGGGGFSSRLMNSIRTEAGLAYSVGSGFSVNKSPGSFQIVMQTKNATVAEAISRARAEVDRIQTQPIGDDELEEAKKYLTGSFPLRLDSDAKIAGFFSQVWFYGLGLDYADTYLRKVNAVTKEDVMRVARQYLHPDRFLEVVVADLSKATIPAAAPDSAPPPAAPQ